MTDEAVNSPIRRSDRYALPPKSGSLLPAAPINAPWRTVSPHLAAWRSPGCKPERLSATAPCVPLRYALPGPILGGVSKGEGPQSRPFVPRGGMGDGWRPPCFWWGSKGEASLRQRYLPLALTWECPPVGAERSRCILCRIAALLTAKPCFLSRKLGPLFALLWRDQNNLLVKCQDPWYDNMKNLKGCLR